MFKYATTFAFMLIFLKKYALLPETIINPKIFKLHNQNNFPKNWYIYIQKHLQSKTEKSFILKNCTQYYLVHILQNHAKETVNFWLKSIRLLDNVQKVRKKSTSQLIAGPSGKLQIKLHNVNTRHSGIKWIEDRKFLGYKIKIPSLRKLQKLVYFDTTTGYEFIHKWNFVLHKLLKPNITFQYINIYIYHDSSCYLGHVVVKSFTKKIDVSKVQYCGTHSLLVVYPLYRNVDIILSFSIHVSSEIISSFNVIDQNRNKPKSIYRSKGYSAKTNLDTIHFKDTYLCLQLSIDS